jgi:hypothetical protein
MGGMIDGWMNGMNDESIDGWTKMSLLLYQMNSRGIYL